MRKTDKKYFEKMVEDKDLVKESFNTDDGIRRAAIGDGEIDLSNAEFVSIPMTVLGGLQFHGHDCVRLPSGVSIPMTVLGGLQ